MSGPVLVRFYFLDSLTFAALVQGDLDPGSNPDPFSRQAEMPN